MPAFFIFGKELNMKRSFVAFTAILFFFATASATTWSPEEFTCPIDKEKNTFMVVTSYGSYIYWWPSKYQWIFWPRTDSPTFYLCKRCHLATYMWDFDKIPNDKIPALKEILAGVKMSKPFKDYQEISTVERLAIMEKVYSVLDTDDEWWSVFYRTQGYHYESAGDAEKAAAARRKSLALTEKQMQDAKSKVPKKLLYYISGAMKHFLNDDKGALADLQKGLETPYASANESAEDQKNAEAGLNERIKDYIGRISRKDMPRDGEK